MSRGGRGSGSQHAGQMSLAGQLADELRSIGGPGRKPQRYLLRLRIRRHSATAGFVMPRPGADRPDTSPAISGAGRPSPVGEGLRRNGYLPEPGAGYLCVSQEFPDPDPARYKGQDVCDQQTAPPCWGRRQGQVAEIADRGDPSPIGWPTGRSVSASPRRGWAARHKCFDLKALRRGWISPIRWTAVWEAGYENFNAAASVGSPSTEPTYLPSFAPPREDENALLLAWVPVAPAHVDVTHVHGGYDLSIWIRCPGVEKGSGPGLHHARDHDHKFEEKKKTLRSAPPTL